MSEKKREDREYRFHGKDPEADQGRGRDLMPEGLHFHSRELPPEPGDYSKEGKRRGGVFKNNPSLILILVDIVVVLLVLIILLPLLRYGSETDDFFGYGFSLHGYLDGNTAYVSVVAQPEFAPAEFSRKEEVPSSTKEEFPQFLLHMGILNTELEETLRFPRNGESGILRTNFDLPEEVMEEKIYFRCLITLGEKSVTLQRKLSP